MKKRLIVSVILFILVISSCMAEGSDKEINFRGLPWGSSYIDVSNALRLNDTVYIGTLKKTYCYSVMNQLTGEHRYKYDGQVCGTASVLSGSVNRILVAGYNVKSVAFTFAYLPDSSGLLTYDDADTALIYASYDLYTHDALSAFCDLKKKLDVLYGDVSDHPVILSVFEDIYIWHGQNGSMVALVYDYGYSKPVVSIRYAFSGGDTLLESARSALILQEKKNAAGDFSGL